MKYIPARHGPYACGAKAYLRGSDFDVNPHAEGTAEHSAWADGWRDTQLDCAVEDANQMQAAVGWLHG